MRIAQTAENAAMTRPKPRCAGFTILELTLILVIVGILASLAVSRGFNTDQETVSGEIETFKARVRYAQSLAFSQTNLPAGSAPITWGVLVSGNSYTLRYNGATSPTVKFPGIGSATATLSGDATFTSGSGTELFFDFRGMPVTSTAGAMSTANQSFTISRGSKSASATVTQKTGFIE